LFFSLSFSFYYIKYFTKKKNTVVTGVVLTSHPAIHNYFFRYIESNKQPSPIKNVTLYICYQVVQGMGKKCIVRVISATITMQTKFNNTLTCSDAMFSSDTFFGNPSCVKLILLKHKNMFFIL